MDDKELIEYFKSQMKEDPDMASAVAAIRTLLEYLKRDKGETIQGLRANLTSAIETLCGVDSSVAVSSGGSSSCASSALPPWNTLITPNVRRS